MRSSLLIKIAVWLVVIGIFALIAPNPAWPEWLARMTLSTGVALFVTTLLVSWFRNRR